MMFIGIQQLKIIGDFTNNPDAFKDVEILSELENETKPRPLKNQGYLS